MSRRPPSWVVWVGAPLAAATAMVAAFLWVTAKDHPRSLVGPADGFVLDAGRGHVVLLTVGAPLLRRDVRTLAVVGPPGPVLRSATERVVLTDDSILVVGVAEGEPLLPGGARDGPLGPPGSPLLLATWREGSVVRVTRDGVALDLDPAVTWPWTSASLSPDATRLAVVKESPIGRHDLFVLAADGRTLIVRTGVEDVAPCWLPNGDGLLFERPRSGVWLEDGEAAEANFVAPIRLSRHPSRLAVAIAHAPGRVVLESLDATGSLALTSILVGTGDGRPSKQLTSGRAAHFGPAVAGDGRFLVFRRTESTPGAGSEAVVLLDRENELHSWVLSRRDDLEADPRLGPQSIHGERFVFIYEEGAVWRFELEPSG